MPLRHYSGSDSDGSRRDYPRQGFDLSMDPFEPSSMMNGLLPNMIRSRHRGRRSGMDMLPFGQNDTLAPFGNSSWPFGSSFRREDPFNSMIQEFMGGQSIASASSMLMQADGNNPNGVYQSSVTMMSSYTDENGQQKVERYKKASCGDYNKDMHEVKEAYSNSATNRDMMAMERRHKNRGIQMIRNRDNNTQVIDETQNPINMEEDEIEQFNEHWDNEFRHMQRYHHPLLQGGPNEQRQRALPPNCERRQLL